MRELDPRRARVFGATGEDYERWNRAKAILADLVARKILVKT